MINKLQQAVDLIKAGDKKQGIQLLAEILKANPHDETAWLWMSEAVNKDDTKRYCLQQILKINPNNEAVKNALAKLESVPPSSELEDSPPKMFSANIIIITVVVLLLLVSGYLGLKEWQVVSQLREHGITTQATVIDKMRGGKLDYRVKYEFYPSQSGLKPIVLTEIVKQETYEGLEIGQPVTLRYLSDNPRIARIETFDILTMTSIGVLIMLSSLVGFNVVIQIPLLWREYRVKHHLSIPKNGIEKGKEWLVWKEHFVVIFILVSVLTLYGFVMACVAFFVAGMEFSKVLNDFTFYLLAILTIVIGYSIIFIIPKIRRRQKKI